MWMVTIHSHSIRSVTFSFLMITIRQTLTRKHFRIRGHRSVLINFDCRYITQIIIQFSAIRYEITRALPGRGRLILLIKRIRSMIKKYSTVRVLICVVERAVHLLSRWVNDENLHWTILQYHKFLTTTGHKIIISYYHPEVSSKFCIVNFDGYP